MTIVITNNVPRPILDSSEIPLYNLERDFDYLDLEALKNGTDSASFFRYHGDYYDLSEFMVFTDRYPTGTVMDGALTGWDAYQSDSYFSGLVIKIADDAYGDQGVIVGRYCS